MAIQYQDPDFLNAKPDESEDFLAAQPEGQQSPPEEPGILRRLGSGISRTMERVSSGPIKGAMEAIQNYEPDGAGSFHPGVLYAMAQGAKKGFTNPEQVQPAKEAFARMGLSTGPTQIANIYPEEAEATGQSITNIPGGPSLAAYAGGALEAATPLPGVGLAAKIAGRIGKTALTSVTKATDLARGTNEASELLQGTKQGIEAYKARQAAQMDAVLNPKLAPDTDKLKAVGKAIGFTPDELSHPAIEFGENSVQARRNKVLAQGEGGAPYLEQHNAMTQKIQNGFDKSIQSIGGPPLEPVAAGELIRSGVKDGAKRIAESVTASHNDIIDQFPGLAVNGAEAQSIESKLNGIEKFAKGRASRGITSEHRSAAQSLMNAVDAVRESNMSYKQLNEAREMAGEAAFGDVGSIGKIPEYQQKMRDLYFTLNDALVGTVGKLDKVRAGQFRTPGTAFEPLKEQLIQSNKILHEIFQDEGAVGRALGDNQKSAEEIFNQAMLYGNTRKVQALKGLLTPEEFQALKGSYLNALIKKGKPEFTYKAAKNTLANNRSVIGEMFADTPQELKSISDIIDLGDRVGPPLLPGSAGQLDFGGVNSIAKTLMHKVTAPIGDVTAEIGKVRAKAGPRAPAVPLELPYYQAAKALRLEGNSNSPFPPYLQRPQ